MLWDCFTFAGEFDLLALRFDTLADVADHFVIAEGTRHFSGQPRAVCHALRERFPHLAGRITHLVVDDLDPQPRSAWANEFRQRNALARGLGSAQPGDWLLLSDVDEIPRPEALAAYRPSRYPSAALAQRLFYYAFNHEVVQSDEPTDVPSRRARLTTVGHLRRWYGSMQNLRLWGSQGRFPRLADRIDRHVFDRLVTQCLDDAGWHFSYLADAAGIARKIAAFSHQEFNQPAFTDLHRVQSRLAAGEDLFGRNLRFKTVALDAGFPAPLRADPARYGGWLFAEPGT